MRKLLKGVAVVGLLLVLVGLVLPSRSEVVREAHLDAAPERVLAALDTLERGPRWCTWTPSQQGSLERTTANERGVWFDVRGRKDRRRRAAIQVSPEGDGSRITWSDAEHYRLDPFARWVALLLRDRLVGPQLEGSLEGLDGFLSDDAP